MLITLLVYMMDQMVNMDLFLLIFNRRKQAGFVNYITFNIFAICLREVYFCESGKLRIL